MSKMHSARTETMLRMSDGSVVLPERSRFECAAILWLKEQSPQTSANDIIQKLTDLTGVANVTIMRQRPLLLVVKYCSKQTRVAELVASLGKEGATIRQVGC